MTRWDLSKKLYNIVHTVNKLNISSSLQSKIYVLLNKIINNCPIEYRVATRDQPKNFPLIDTNTVYIHILVQVAT